MKSIDERLADSNPVAQGYVPAHYEQMITRAVHHGRGHDAVWKAFRLRMAGAVTAVSAVTVLAVSALNGAGAALPVLGFSAAGQATSPQAASTKIFGGAMMPVMINYTFTGSDAFSGTAGSAPVYDISAPTDLSATLNAVARAVGVSLASTPTQGNSSSYYGVTGPGYSGSVDSSGASDYWNIYATSDGVKGVSGTATASSSGAGATGATGVTGATGATGVTGATGATGATGVAGVSGVSDSTGPVAATGSLAAQAVGYVRAMGDYTTGDATQTVSAGVTTVNVPVLINGLVSDMSDSFTFNADGTLQSASGEVFTLTPVATYPLLSPSAGVDQIAVQQRHLRGFVAYATNAVAALGAATSVPPSVGGPLASAATGPTGPSGATGPTGSTGPTGATGVSGASGVIGSTTTTIAPTPTEVNLTTVSTGYASYEMTGNVWMELPVYDYTGTVVTGDYQVDFTVVPLPTKYLNFATDTSPVPLGAR